MDLLRKVNKGCLFPSRGVEEGQEGLVDFGLWNRDSFNGTTDDLTNERRHGCEISRTEDIIQLGHRVDDCRGH